MHLHLAATWHHWPVDEIALHCFAVTLLVLSEHKKSMTNSGNYLIFCFTLVKLCECVHMYNLTHSLMCV